MRPGSVTTPASTTVATATGTTWPSSPREWCTTGTSSRARLGSGDAVALRVGRESPALGSGDVVALRVGRESPAQGWEVASRVGRESRERAGHVFGPTSPSSAS